MRLLLLVAAALLAARCQDELPAAPDVLVEGVTIYEHAGFAGKSALLTADAANLKDFKGPCEHDAGDVYTYDWNDCISSIWVRRQWSTAAPTASSGATASHETIGMCRGCRAELTRRP